MYVWFFSFENAKIITSLCQKIKIPFLSLRNHACPISMIKLLLIFKNSSLFSNYYLTILSYDNNHQIATSEIDLQLDKKPIFLLVVNGHYAYIFNLRRYLIKFKLVSCDF